MIATRLTEIDRQWVTVKTYVLRTKANDTILVMTQKGFMKGIGEGPSVALVGKDMTFQVTRNEAARQLRNARLA